MAAMVKAADRETGTREMVHQRLVSPRVLAYPVDERDNRPRILLRLPAPRLELHSTRTLERGLGHSRHKHPN